MSTLVGTTPAIDRVMVTGTITQSSVTLKDAALNWNELPQVKVIALPASLPSGTPGGVPTGKVTRLRLEPFGPFANRKKTPPLAGGKLNVALICWLSTMLKDVAGTTVPPLTAVTEVTLAVTPSPWRKAAPVIATFCVTAQSPEVGTAERTTGARVPSNDVVEVSVTLLIAPNALLSPAV